MAPGLVALPERMFRPDEAAEVAAAPAVQEARGYLTQVTLSLHQGEVGLFGFITRFPSH